MNIHQSPNECNDQRLESNQITNENNQQSFNSDQTLNEIRKLNLSSDTQLSQQYKVSTICVLKELQSMSSMNGKKCRIVGMELHSYFCPFGCCEDQQIKT